MLPQGAGLHALHCLGLLLPVVLAPLHHLARPLVHDPLLPVPGLGHGKQVGPFLGLDSWNLMLAGGLPEVCVCAGGCPLPTCSPGGNWPLAFLVCSRPDALPAPQPLTPG